MRITPDRIAHCGAFGRPSTRMLGAWVVYVSLDRPFELLEKGQSPAASTFALVAPWSQHRVCTPDRNLALVLIEPESVDGEALKAMLMGSDDDQQAYATAIRNGFEHDPATAEDFDHHFFGCPLPTRQMDPRIRRAVDLVTVRQASSMTAHECAKQIALSPSHFMHLFRTDMYTTFRRFRAWKRARRLLCMMGGQPSLVDVALTAGYADSTHLCRSVRSYYGYTPSAMFDGSRRLAVITH